MDFAIAQRRVGQNKLDEGFGTTDVPLEFCLRQAEVAEAFEAWPKGRDNLGEELADVAIYLLAPAEIAKNEGWQYRRGLGQGGMRGGSGTTASLLAVISLGMAGARKPGAEALGAWLVRWVCRVWLLGLGVRGTRLAGAWLAGHGRALGAGGRAPAAGRRRPGTAIDPVGGETAKGPSPGRGPARQHGQRRDLQP